MSDSSDAVRDHEHAHNEDRVETELLLWHYTSLESLLKILDSEQPSIRATSIAYLNDSLEYRFTVEAFRREIQKRKARETDPGVLGLYDELISLLLVPEWKFPYVFSLSTQADDLAQWRAYGDGGSGCALGFSHSRLLAYSEMGHGARELVRCEYAKPGGEPYVNQHLDAIRYNFEQTLDLFPQADDPKREAAISASLQLTEMLLPWAVRVKSEGFRAESEWRLVVSPSSAIVVSEYRATSTTLVPFVTVPLPAGWNDPTTPLLVEVMLGPTTNPELALAALRRFLKDRQLSHVKASRSTIPYRILPAR